jgi:hypothetical protein
MRREEMSQIVTDVKNRIGADVSNQLSNFFATHGVSLDEFCTFTDVNRDEVRRILGGNNNISLDTFVKIMVATGNAIEIKSIMPKSNGNGRVNHMRRPTMPMPHMGEMPMDEHMRRIPFGGITHNRPRPWDNATETCEMPPMFESPQTETRNDIAVGQSANSLHSKSREELVDMVCNLGLENEIDLRRATRSALINFLALNFDENTPMTTEMPRPSMENVANSRPVSDRNADATDLSRVMEKIHSLMTSNPQLKENITRLFGE